MSEKEREDVIPYETICNNHLHTIWMLKQFKKTGDMWYIDQSIKLIKYCKKQGQHMESRMAQTRSAIESCGYKRVYKAKGKRKKSWQK
jgi:DNA-directed RNA polymerase subunit RPC12/RpoP